jgi:hypothetical protein
MKRIKHSKVKNTGLIFELLVRQVASDTMNNRDSKALRIIKRNFKPNSLLAQELKLYRSLHEEKFTNAKAETFVTAVTTARKTINEALLKREKYNLIKEIRSAFNIEDFFKSRVSNYKLHAAIYKLFEHAEADDPKEYVENKFAILEHVATVAKKSTDTKSALVAEQKDLRILASKIMVEKFNEKYSVLSKAQKQMLREYINNVTNSTELKKYVLRETKTLQDQLTKLKTTIPSKVLRIKLTEVANLLNQINKKHTIEDKDVLTMLKYYELVDELNKVKG